MLLRSILRRLKADRWFTAFVLLAIGLTTGLCFAVLSIASTIFLRPLPFVDPDQLVAIGPAVPGTSSVSAVSAHEVRTWRVRLGTSARVFAIEPVSRTIVLPAKEAFEVQGLAVSSDTMPALGVPAVIGRTFVDTDYQTGSSTSIVLSYDTWKRISQIIGRDVVDGVIDIGTFQGTIRHTVIGVMPAGFALRADSKESFYLPLKERSAEGPASSAAISFLAFARLGMGVSATETQALLRAPGMSERRTARGPLVVRPLSSVFASPHIKALTPLVIAGGLILVLTCANISALFISRAITSLGQFRIRLALGAGTRDLVRHVLAESLILWTVGGVLGILFGTVMLRLLQTAAPPALLALDQIDFGWQPIVAVFMLCLTSAFLSSLLPALRLTGSRLALDSRGFTTSARGTAGFLSQRALTLAQVTLVMCLLSSATLIGRSVLNLLQAPLGFEADRIVATRVRFNIEHYGQEGENLQRRVSEALSSPLFEAVGWTSELPLAHSGRIKVMQEDHSSLFAGFRIIDAGYFGTIRARIASGRLIEAADSKGAPVAVVNAAFANSFLGGSAVGRKLFIDDWREVVGVIEDIREGPLSEPMQPTVYWPFDTRRWLAGAPWLVARTALPPDTAFRQVKEVLRTQAPNLPVLETTTLFGRRAAELEAIRFLQAALSLFGVVAAIIAATGVFGVTAHASAKRIREFGVRQALGATPRFLLWCVARDSATVATAGCVAGALLSLWSGRWLQSWIHGVSPTDPVTLMAVGAFLLLLCASAACSAARNAVRVNPAISLNAGVE